MSTRFVNHFAARLGNTQPYPDWYVVRRLARQRLAVWLRGGLRRPLARLMRDPGCVLRLTLSPLPELSLFPDDHTRRDTLREFGRTMRDVRDWRYWLMLGLLTAVAGAAGLFVGQLAAWSLGGIAVGAVNYWLRLLTMGLTFWFLMSRTQRLGAANRLRLRLIELGIPVCLKCGYALFGHTPGADRCPECGCAIDGRIVRLLNEQRDERLVDENSEWDARAA